MDILSTLEPQALWSVFAEVCAIPHPSHHEEALAQWALGRARRHGLEARIDAAGNVIIRKPASPGLEGKAGVVLQAHLDMVPQKEAGVPHDFLRDPIVPRLDPADPEWLRASGTTLGADNGIGIAAGFALLEDADLRHGPLELLLTVVEEDGMNGARDLQPGSLSGRFLVNLDGEAEDELCVGSAGSRRVHFGFPEETVQAPGGYTWLGVGISGLKGGHSGGDIHLGRANAIRVLLDLIAPEAAAGGPGGLLLAELGGGSLANAIARDGSAVVGVPEPEGGALCDRIKGRAAKAAAAFRAADPCLTFTMGEASAPKTCLSAEASARVLRALDSVPDGLESLMEGMDDVARLSSNLGALETRHEGGRLVIAGKILARGAYDAERAARVDRIVAALESGGAAIDLRPVLAAWSPDPGSALLAAAKRAWREVFGKEPAVRATHGGLECSLVRIATPGLDVISVGATIRFPHSPDEAVRVASVGRFLAAARRLVEVLSD